MKNQIKIGAILSYIYLFITNIIGLVYTPIMLRLMGQTEYGLYSLIASFIGYLTVLDLGFGNAIVVYTSKYRAKNNAEDEKKLHGMFLVIYTIIGIIASFIGIVLYLNIDNIFGNTFSLEEIEKAKIMMAILTFNLVITFPLSIFGNIITAYEEFVFSKVVNIVRQLLNPLIMLPLLYMGYKSIAMTIVITVLNIICLLINMIFCFKKLNIKIKFKGFDKVILKTIFGYSIWIFLAVIVDKINWQVDQFILGAVAGTISVAIYSLAAQLNTIYLAFSTAISGVLLPKVSKMVENNASNKELSDIFIKTGRLQYLLMMLIITGFILFGNIFINLWAGEEYSSAYVIACILMIPVTIPLTQNLGISILQAKNLHKFRTVLYICLAIINVIISIPLASAYGGVGSAIGTAISLLLGNCLIMNIYYNKIGLNMKLYWKNIFKISIPIAILFTVSMILLFSKSVVIDNNWISLMVAIVVYTIIYVFSVYKFSMNQYEKDIVNNIKKRLKL